MPRRIGFVTRRTATLLALGAVWTAAAPGQMATAMEVGEARDLVRGAIDDIIGLVSSGIDADEAAQQLRAILETRSSVPALARYSAGEHWRGMSAKQRQRFTDAFARHVSGTYARQFSGYDVRAEDLRRHIRVAGVTDAGRKGLLVRVEVTPPGAPPVTMGFLVSDKPGRPVIADLILGGISLAITQREIIQEMFVARGGDVERMIADLNAADGAALCREGAPSLC